MTQSTVDKLYTLAAIRLAANGLYSVTRNNPRVGCLVVKNRIVIGRGFHQTDGGPHAEVQAINACSEDPRGATAYVSLEPCCRQNRTPPCTSLLISSGIRRVVIGELDPNPQVNGKGVKTLQEATISVTVLGLAEAKMLNLGFRKRMTRGRPYVRLKCGMSLDGRVAMASGESQWITDAEARRDVQRLRARSGAIITGINTVLQDDPRLTVRDPQYPTSRPPLRVVLDTNCKLPEDAELLKHPGDIVVVCHESANPPEQVAKWAHSDSRAKLDHVHKRLAEQGVNEVLVEAGPTLTTSYLQAGLWDELVCYLAPKLLGSGAKAVTQLKVDSLCDAIEGRLQSANMIGENLRVVIEKHAAHG